MELYSSLPVFTGPNMLPEKNMTHYRDHIRPHMEYCPLPMVPKLMAWCKHIIEYDLRMKLMAKYSSLNHTNNQSTVNSTIKTMEDCYDSYNCNVPSLASTVHSLMAVMSVIALIALIFNLYCFIQMYLKFNRNFVRNSFGIHLSTIIIVDCIKLVLITLLYIVPGLSGNVHQAQLSMYQRYSVFVFPILLPLLDFCFAIVSWLVVSLLVQRSHVTRAKIILEEEGSDFGNVSSRKDRRRSVCCVILTIVALFVFTVPKFAEYTFSKHMVTGKGIIIPLIRVFKLYRIVYLKFLSPTVECMMPIIVMLAYIAVIKYNEFLLTKFRDRRQLKIVDPKADNRILMAYNAKVLSVTGISRKTQLIIWVSVVVLVNLTIKLSDMFVALEPCIERSPKENWLRMRQIVKYLFIFISVITVAAKPVIYIHCCPRFLKKSSSTQSKETSGTMFD